MEIIELAISNFKRFASERLTFSPGINLIWGPNESGKSTIHEAVCCALFGRERNKPVESWSGGSSVAELTYRSRGTIYKIERRLTDGVNRLGILSGEELVDVTTAKDQIAKSVADHLGISSRSVFDNTVSVRQMNLSRPGAGEMEAVGGEIQRVLTGTAHVSADEVRKCLEAGRDAIKGRARPTNPREYDSIAERLTKLADELADARNSRTQIKNLEVEQAELGARIARDSERVGILDGLQERHKRWTELSNKAAELNVLHESCFNTLRDIRHTVEDLGLIQKELEGYTELVGKDEELAEHLTKIGGKREELESRLKEFEAAGIGTPSVTDKPLWIGFIAAAAVLGLVSVAIWLFVDHGIALLPASIAGAAAVAGIAIKCMHGKAGGGIAGIKHLAGMAESARAELEHLDVEEQSILTYMKCQDAGRAWAKVKNYRNLANRARELEATLKGLLAGRGRDDWEAQESDLSRELSGVRRELDDDFVGYAPSMEEAESWRSEFASLQNSLPLAQARLHEVLGSLETERRNARDLAALEGELEFMHKRKSELEFIYKAYEEAVSAVESVTQTVSKEYLPDLSEQASTYLRRLTSGRYTSVCVKPGWEISADCCDKSEVRPTSLSLGTLDQLYFALRLGCGELLSAGRKLPIMLDDPFAAFDQQRLDNALELLKLVAQDNQVLIFSHDPYILDWACGLVSAGEVPCMVHELAPPAA